MFAALKLAISRLGEHAVKKAAAARIRLPKGSLRDKAVTAR